MTAPASDSIPVEDAPGRWRALGVLGGAVVLAMTTWFSATAVLPQLRITWGLSTTAGSMLTIAVQLGFVVGALASAGLNLPDLIPPRRLILLGATGAAVANGLLLLADGPELAVPLRFATGVALAGVYPPALKAMATWFRRGRGTALGAMVGALTLGSALPHLINGFGGLDWRLVVIGTSGFTLAGGVLAAVAGRDGPFPFPRAVFDSRCTFRVFANRGVRLSILGYFGHMWELYAMWAWFATFYTALSTQRGSDDPVRDAAFATFAVIGVGAAGCAVGGILGDRWGRARTTALAMSLSGACALGIGLLRDAPLSIVFGVGLIWGFWVIADSAQFSALVSERADQRYVGTALTVQLAAGFVLTVATIWLIPVLLEATSWRWAFAALAPGPMLGAVAMWHLDRLDRARSSAAVGQLARRERRLAAHHG